MFSAKIQGFPNRVQFYAAVLPMGRELFSKRGAWFRGTEAGVHGRAGGKVNRLAIVGIDEAEVPQLRALVEIWSSRRYDLQHRLAEAIYHSGVGNALLKREEIA